MICKKCAEAADTHGMSKGHCHDKSRCDCQHRPRGTLIKAPEKR